MRIRKITQIASAAFVIIAMLVLISSCLEGSRIESPTSPFKSFRDVPGVTDEEIAAIEALQKEYALFTYGMTLATEAFQKENGEIGGYAALVCEWLTNLFGIRFEPGIYQPNETIEKLVTYELDFSGTMRITEERMKTYYMTDAISERRYIMFRLAKSRGIAQILHERPLKYAVLEGFTTPEAVDLITSSVNCEVIWVNNYAEAYSALESGDADAFLGVNVSESSFDAYGKVTIENFFPLIFSAVSMATANPKFEPVISVVNKAMRNGASAYLNYLYNRGYDDYLRHKFTMSLSDEERAYIGGHSVVPIAANYSNYPVSFYNERDKERQGIFFDLLDEITELTGISFDLVIDDSQGWSPVYEKLINGEVAFVPDLIRTKERENNFIWPETAIQNDYYALISKADHRDIAFNEILHVKVGLAGTSAYALMFKQWFPNHTGTVEYETMEEAMSALQRGEVDMVMATQRRLLLLTHYQELPGYKANVVFDQPIETIFGFNKDETILCSIIDKALKTVDTKGISDRWMRKTYDYRAKMAEARLPWLLGATVLSLVILTLMLIMFYRNRNEGKRLEKLMAEQTKELQLQAGTLTALFDSIPDLLFTQDMNRLYTRCNKSLADHFGFNQKDVVGKSTLAKFGVDSELLAYHNKFLQAAIDNSQIYITESIMPRFDGAQMVFEATHAPLVVNGVTVGVLGLARDITQRKAMEEEARRASETKGRFIADMSHEMSTPMNVIVGLTDLMLEEDGISDEAKEALIKINTAGNTLMEIINDILDLPKIEPGQNKRPYEKVARPDLSYARVLVVGDSPADLDVTTRMLRKYKMQVDCAGSGQEAVDRIAAGEPVYDAVFMDNMMSGMDGMEAIAEIRALDTKYAKNIPVIALAANFAAGSGQMFLKNGFSAFLPKPFKVMSLDSIVQRWVRNTTKEYISHIKQYL